MILLGIRAALKFTLFSFEAVLFIWKLSVERVANEKKASNEKGWIFKSALMPKQKHVITIIIDII